LLFLHHLHLSSRQASPRPRKLLGVRTNRENKIGSKKERKTMQATSKKKPTRFQS
jgi:hypothetical protein